jgi:hypothetical protein
MDTMKKAILEQPSLAMKTGWDYIQLTGEYGGDEYGAYSAGRPTARFQDWVPEKMQPIFDAAAEADPRQASAYDVASTQIYVGGAQSHSIDFGVIQLATPGSDPGDSFFRTGLSVLHELGHQYQMAQWAGWGFFKDIWDKQLEQVGGSRYINRLYSIPGTFEWGADQFRDNYAGMLFR